MARSRATRYNDGRRVQGLLHPSRVDHHRQCLVSHSAILIAQIMSDRIAVLFRALLHDPQEYPDPEAFRPERFLRADAEGKLERDPSVRDPRFAAFGFGRR